MVHVEKRPLKVFLCHASGDKPPVRDLYKRLTAEGVDAWLDKERLLPGQDWRMEIPRAVRDADVVVICLSKKSVTKEGYVQKEIKFALDSAEEKPEGTIFLIPARLEDCAVPERLNRWQWVDLYEEDGFIKLLRSLKLRADAVDAAVEPALYVDSTKELDRKLEQLYTEGLAAFYTEDWDRACQRFQSILSERPNHKNASEKLEEAKRQRTLAKLYGQATGAVHSEDWETAIAILEELSQKSADYKDAAQLLRDARKQEQLKELYTEARTLHAAQKWQAVVKVFDQIKSIDSNYPDSEGLLPSAQKEVAELKRLTDLNDQYSHALREMEAGNWYEARRLLEAIHKSSFAFLETENLLKKVEKEIAREEEKRKQNDRINTLYEQAHGLLRAKKWRNALEKIEEIGKLDHHFVDTDEIAEKARKELEREEEEAERQNKLAAMYAEAVRLLKEEKYQEALDKWQEVKALDPKYPDRQWVQRTAKRKLAGKSQPPRVDKKELPLQNIGVGWLILLAAIGFGLARLIQQYLGMLFPIPPEFGWGSRGVLQGLIMALVLGIVGKDWKWKALLIFVMCWAIIYPINLRSLNQQSMLLTSMILSMAPVLAIIIASLWVKKREQWQTYALIFTGWTLAWLIGQNAAGLLDPVFHGASIRWVFCDAIAGGIGLWITIDLLKSKSDERPLEATPAIVEEQASGSENLLLLTSLSVVVLRAIWGVFQDWFHVWDAGVAVFLQFMFLSVLGGVYGVVVAFSIKKIVPNWKAQHSLTIIIGWALGMGLAMFAYRVGLEFIDSVMVLCGLSAAVAIAWANPSTSPIKLTLIFLCWALSWKYGSMLGGYIKPNFGTDYTYCFADAITILLGLLATFAIYEYSSTRMVKVTLIAVIGFALGNYLATPLTGSLSMDDRIGTPLLLAIWGFVAGTVFELFSRNLKRILISGSLCATGLVIGYFSALLLMPTSTNLRNILWGAWLGIAFGLPARRAYKIILLSILGSAMFTITSIYIVTILQVVTPSASLLRGAWIGLVLGFGYAYITRDMENSKLAG